MDARSPSEKEREKIAPVPGSGSGRICKKDDHVVGPAIHLGE